MSRITDYIRRFTGLTASKKQIIDDGYNGGFNPFCCDELRPYSRLIWYNICDILVDIAEDVQIIPAEGNSDIYKFAAFKSFFYAYGKATLQRIFDDGFVAIGYDGVKYWLMNQNEYSTRSANGVKYAVAVAANVEVYVMRSSCYVSRKVSDKQLCQPILSYLDDVLNASATISKRLGCVVIASPKNLSNAPTSIILTDEQKQNLEKQLAKNYGALNNQSNIMLLPREMSFETINLAGIDIKTNDKAKLAILALCDRIKVPANQVAIIDANSSKTLANGGELREGDKAKYKSFRRLFEHTFVQMAIDLNIKINYTISGEPIDEVVADILS